MSQNSGTLPLGPFGKEYNTMTLKLLTMTAIAVATLSFGAAQAFAESPTEMMPPPHEENGGEAAGENAGGGPRADKFEKRGREMFEKTDANKDGFLSKEEMAESHRQRMEEMFNKTDANKDGKLSPEELQKGREAMREKFKEKFKERKEHQPEHKDGDKPSE
jgi:hypothetical protein